MDNRSFQKLMENMRQLIEGDVVRFPKSKPIWKNFSMKLYYDAENGEIVISQNAGAAAIWYQNAGDAGEEGVFMLDEEFEAMFNAYKQAQQRHQTAWESKDEEHGNTPGGPA